MTTKIVMLKMKMQFIFTNVMSNSNYNFVGLSQLTYIFQTFMLEPINQIFTKTFANPTRSSFNWIGASEADVIFLNDFRYDSTHEIIPWSDLLNLLDGSKLHVAAPKTSHAKDIAWTEKQPIFATGPEKIQRFYKGTTSINAGETKQMDARWVYVHLTHIIKEIDNEIISCGRCFAQLILDEN